MRLLFKLSMTIGLILFVSYANSFSFRMYKTNMEESYITKFCMKYRCVNQVFTHVTEEDISLDTTKRYYDVYYYATRRIGENELCQFADDLVGQCTPHDDGDGDEGGLGGKG